MSGYVLNEKLRSLSPYDPVSGQYPIRLDANESFITPEAGLTEAITRRIAAASLNRYPDPYAAELCSLYGSYCGVPGKNIVAGNGSDELISLITAAFFNKGDKILTFVPDFAMYKFYAYVNEMETVFAPKDDNFNIDIEAACELVNRQNIKGVFLSNPCNPTSVGIPSADILRLAEQTKALIVIDEAYMEFYGDSVLNRLNEFDNLIVLKTCSKALGMAGIRLGFAISGDSIINALRAVKSPYNVNRLTQLTGCAVLEDRGRIEGNIKAIVESRESLYKAVKELEGGRILRVYPTKTNFVFMKADGGKDIFQGMKSRGIVIRSLGDFLRITAGTAEENHEAVIALAEEVLK